MVLRKSKWRPLNGRLDKPSMKTIEEIRERIEDESEMLREQRGHIASITRGFLMALEWVLEND
jgi:hypothetical protein